jgi:hypothetical protein
VRRRKYNNVRTVLDGYLLDSKAEAARYGELRLMERANHISDLHIHPKYPIEINGQKICTYIADFSYRDKNGTVHVEDVKGMKTALYSLKKKLLKATCGLEVEEVTKVARGTFPGVDIDKIHRK